MKYGLVLAGGGAKGVYQLGAWKAMREIGVEFCAIAGVSIGSINGALIASDSYEEAKELWKEASIDKGINISHELKEPERLFSFRNVPTLIREIWKNGGIDASPTKELISTFIDEKKVRESGVDLGMITFSLSDYSSKEIFLKDIPDGMLLDYLLASSKVPGVSNIGPEGERFLDGGVYDNTPVEMMLRNGYTNLVVVDISNLKGIGHRVDFTNAQLVYIRPNNVDELGAAFDFSEEMYEKRIKMGYLDAKKAFGLLSGRLYYFGKDVFREMVVRYGAEACQQLEEMALELGLERLAVYTPDSFVAQLKELYTANLEEYNKRQEEAEQKRIYGQFIKRMPLFKSGKDYTEAIAILDNIIE
ncbi:MAG: patatin-like phospholipase family protein [Clostridia bacterium]|nr:patatin-like phospholipase family protein [Clostridia bacterium]